MTTYEMYIIPTNKVKALQPMNLAGMASFCRLVKSFKTYL